jgi:hypothetical protein
MRWSTEEDETIRTYYPKHGTVWEWWDVVLPDRTQNAIQSRAIYLGVRLGDRGRPRSHGTYVNMSAELACASIGEEQRAKLRYLVSRALDRRTA